MLCTAKLRPDGSGLNPAAGEGASVVTERVSCSAARDGCYRGRAACSVGLWPVHQHAEDASALPGRRGRASVLVSRRDGGATGASTCTTGIPAGASLGAKRRGG